MRGIFTKIFTATVNLHYGNLPYLNRHCEKNDETGEPVQIEARTAGCHMPNSRKKWHIFRILTFFVAQNIF